MNTILKKIGVTFQRNKSNLIFILISFGILVAYIFLKEDVATLGKTIQTLKIQWIIAAVFCIVVYWFLEGVILHIFTKSYHKEQKLKTSIRTAMIGQFFSCITPFSSGGQPLQALHMVKNGISLGFATCSLLSKFIVFQVVLTLYSTFLLITQIDFFRDGVSSFKTLAFIGFSINIIVVLALFCAANSARFSKIIVSKGITCLGKISIFKKPLVKNPEEKINYLYRAIDEFNENFKEIRKNIKVLLLGSGYTFLQLNFYFLVTYCIYLAFGLPPGSMIIFIAAQGFVQMISAFIPLPGGSGGAELSFLAFFTLLFPQQYITLAMLLWRIITFYLTILVSMGFVGDLFLKHPKEEGK